MASVTPVVENEGVAAKIEARAAIEKAALEKGRIDCRFDEVAGAPRAAKPLSEIAGIVDGGIVREPLKPRPTLSEEELAEFFYGHSGQAKLVAAIQYACKYAQAQCPREEIIAALAVHNEAVWPSDLASKVFEFAAETIMKARLAARAEVRIAIYEAAFDSDVKPGQIGLLKAFAFEHLDWSREPIDAQMKKALREAEEEIAKGNMQ